MPPIEDKRVTELVNDVKAMKPQLQDVLNMIAVGNIPKNGGPANPQELLAAVKPTINTWIKNAIYETAPDIIRSKLPGAQESFEAQKKLIEAWLDERYLNGEIPRLIEEANDKTTRDLGKRINTVESSVKKVQCHKGVCGNN